MTALDLQTVQRLRKGAIGIGLLLFFLLAAVSRPVPLFDETIHETLELAGLLMMFVAILGRAWCTLYIGGRKKRVLVRTGPYSLMRNPLYSFTFIGALGVGLEFGGVSFAVIALLLTWFVFQQVVAQEEPYLAQVHGQEYIEYRNEVPRFLPRFSGWRDDASLEVTPNLVVRTVLDASLLILALPLFEVIEALQDMDILPVLFRFY